MRSLGEVLEAMVTCGERWPSVHAELVHRHDPGTAADARRSVSPDLELPGPGDGSGVGGASSLVSAAAFVPAPAPPAHGEDATDPVVRRGRLLAAAGMLRVEWPDEDEVTVVAGEHWRRRRGEEVSGTGTIGAPRPRPGQLRRPGIAAREQLLVRPWLLLSWLRPRLVAQIHVGGRPSTRLAAVPRAHPPALAGFAEGTQRFDLVVDDETGVVVELTAFYEGRVLERVALRHVTVGDTADPRLFDLACLDLGPVATGPAPAPPAPRPGPPAPPARQAGALAARPHAELVG
ncbi:hypothetical protein I6A81_40455, partial [Frankia sp. CN7]